MNNVFIIIDALRQDVLSRMYKEGRLSGGFKFLIENGTVCENAYANGCPTQFSFPSIFTSTLPLEYGGYDRGIIDRPVHIAEIFHRHGYYTLGFATGPWETGVFGYDRGYHRYYHAFDIYHYVDPIFNQVYRQYYLDTVRRHPQTLNQMKAAKKRFFKLALRYVLSVLRGETELDLPKYFMPFCRSDYQAVESYYQRLIDHPFPDTLLDMSIRPFSFRRIPPSFFERSVMTIMNRLKPDLITPQSQFFPTRYLADLCHRSIQTFSNPAIRTPHFHVLHSLDLHEKRHTEQLFQINYPSRNPYSKSGSRYALYEQSLEHIDCVLGTYIRELDKRGLLEHTMIAAVGDHGFHDGYPSRRSFGLPESETCDIYHESLDCAMIFYHPNRSARRFSKHCSLLDVSPTLLDLMKFPTEPSFSGQSIYRDPFRERVISESCGKGPCHLPTKPIYLSIKKPPYKLIYREYFHEKETIRKTTELFLLSDRFEKRDISGVSSHRKGLDGMIRLALNRIRDIRSYPGCRRLTL